MQAPRLHLRPWVTPTLPSSAGVLCDAGPGPPLVRHKFLHPLLPDSHYRKRIFTAKGAWALEARPCSSE